MSMKRTIAILIAAAFSFAASAQARLIVPEGDFSMGAQFASVSCGSSNSEFMLLLNPIDAEGRATRIAPFFEYSYKDNRAIGARLQFFTGSIAVDKLTLDMLNEGLSFDVGDIDMQMRSFGASVFHRNYYGLDDRGRVGIISEFALGMTSGNTGSSKSMGVSLSYSPGFVFYVMNNVSVSCTLSMASISYNSVKCYSDGIVSGSRSKFGARAGIDILGLNFGMSFHF